MKKISAIFICLFLLGTTVVLGSGEEFLDNTIFSGDTDDTLIDSGIDILEQFNGDNIMMADSTVVAEGEAKDLLMLAGATINSMATGSYGFMAADIVNISGDIFKDTFVAGNNINIMSNIGRDVYAFGSKINMNGTIGRDMYAGGGEININGSIGRNAHLTGNKVIISSTSVINGDVVIDANRIVIEDGAIINGVVSYNSNAEYTQIPSNITTNVNIVEVTENRNTNVFISKIKDIAIWMLINIILFVVTMLIAPGLFEKIETAYKNKGGSLYASSIGWGVILLVVIPIIAIIALITVIGSALGFATLLAYTVIMVYATVLVGYLLGVTMFSKTNMNKYLVGIIGIAVVEILRNLPAIGGVISFVVILIALGIIKEIMKKGKDETIVSQENS